MTCIYVIELFGSFKTNINKMCQAFWRAHRLTSPTEHLNKWFRFPSEELSSLKICPYKYCYAGIKINALRHLSECSSIQAQFYLWLINVVLLLFIKQQRTRH